MPFNGAGVYSAPGADFPVVTQTVISSTHFNNTITDIATALSLCLTKDGQQVATANIPFGGFRATNVGITAVAGSVGTPAINVSDAATGLYRSAASELAVTVAGTQRARFDATGLIVTGVGTFSGATSTTTLTASTSVVTPLLTTSGAVNLGLGTQGVQQWSLLNAGGDLIPGNLISNIGGPANLLKALFTPTIDSGTTGALSLKTNNGTTQVTISHTASAVNRIDITGGATGNDVIISALGEANVGIRLVAAGTGAVSFEAPGGTTQFKVLQTPSSTRFITVSGSNGGNPTISTSAGSLAITPDTTIAGGLNPNFTSAETAVTGTGTTVTVAHGLAVVPRGILVVIRCKTAEFGYSIGDEVVIASTTVVSVYADTVNIGMVVNTGQAVGVIRRDTFALAAITVANWKYVVRAWK